MARRLGKGQAGLISEETTAIMEFRNVLGSSVNIEVICPFCAWKGKVIEFRNWKSPASKEYSIKMFRCPDCGQRMARRTLFKDMSVSDWARWLYFDVIGYRGYDRIDFPKLLKRLKEYGWANEFWTAWRAAKDGRETSDVEDYADYLRTSANEAKDKCDKFHQGIAGKNAFVCTTCDIYHVCWPKALRT